MLRLLPRSAFLRIEFQNFSTGRPIVSNERSPRTHDDHVGLLPLLGPVKLRVADQYAVCLGVPPSRGQLLRCRKKCRIPVDGVDDDDHAAPEEMGRCKAPLVVVVETTWSADRCPQATCRRLRSCPNWTQYRWCRQSGWPRRWRNRS